MSWHGMASVRVKGRRGGIAHLFDLDGANSADEAIVLARDHVSGLRLVSGERVVFVGTVRLWTKPGQHSVQESVTLPPSGHMV